MVGTSTEVTEMAESDECPHGCPMDRGVHRPQCQLYGPRPDTLLGVPDGTPVVLPPDEPEGS